jgi:hypothetical protein
MDVDDLTGSIQEAVRVLRHGGRLMFGVVHPMADHHFLREQGTDPGSYFGTHPLDTVVEIRGVPMHFRGWRRPRSAYFDAVTGAGLHVSKIAEPQPDPDAAFTRNATRWNGLPLFFWAIAHKPTAGETV